MLITDLIQRKLSLGYSNEEIARLSGIPVSTIQKIFSGTTKAPRASTLRALEKVLTESGVSFSVSADPVKDQPLLAAESSSPLEVGASLDHIVNPDPSRKYTVRDYEALPDDQRVELIDGQFFEMEAPGAFHQALSVFLASELLQHVLTNRGACRVFTAPFDVQLDKDIYTILQPDVLVCCDPALLENKKRAFGAPEFVIEILSPSTRRKDILIKTDKYRNAGVREYWIIDPKTERIIVYLFDDDTILYTYTFEDKVPVGIWNGALRIDFAKIMEHLRPLL